MSVDYTQALTLILFYMVIYNAALAVLFLVLTQLTNNNFTTTFSFYTIPQGTLASTSLLIAFFSMAGVPPFVGFFSKLVVLVLLANSYFFILFPVFFILLFSGLYFYIQNIRLILTSVDNSLSKPVYIKDLNTRHTHLNFLLLYSLLTFLMFGIAYLEDIILLCNWFLL